MKSAESNKSVLKWFSLKRILIPVLIGLAVSFLLIINDIRSGVDLITISSEAVFWFSLAVILQCIRDFAYMVRIRLLTDNELSWRESFEVIMLWEFASSVTPSVVGGSAIAFFIIKREGYNIGKSTSIVLVSAMLDELFYIITVPLVLLVSTRGNHFIQLDNLPWNISTFDIFIIAYSFILFLTLVILTGIFISPVGLKRVLTGIFRVKFLHRWQAKMSHIGDEIILTSAEMRSRSWKFWIKLWLITFLSWTSRFLVVNALIAGINPVSNHLLLYSRQLIMWVILLISPTPGGSGTAEFFFPIFLDEFIIEASPDFMALLWRLMTYYPYFIVGSIVLPIWLKRTKNQQLK